MQNNFAYLLGLFLGLLIYEFYLICYIHQFIRAITYFLLKIAQFLVVDEEHSVGFDFLICLIFQPLQMHQKIANPIRKI